MGVRPGLVLLDSRGFGPLEWKWSSTHLMSSHSTKREPKRLVFRTGIGALAVLLLLIAEAFAVTHPYDSAAHDNGTPCAVCVSVATLGAAAVSSPPQLEVVITPATPIELVATTVPAAAPARRYARGPPIVSFSS